MASGSGRKKRAPQSLRSHPLFTPGVALWFAALFGLSSLAVRTNLLEAIVQTVGLPALIPAAAPPLGMTARVLIAFAMTLVGVGVGFVVGRIMAGMAPEAPRKAASATPVDFAPEPVAEAPFEPELPAFRKRDLHPDAPVRAPVQAPDELGAPLDAVVEQSAEMGPDSEAQPVTGAKVAPRPEVEVLPPIAESAPERPEPLPLSTAAQRIADAELDDLSNVELAERLAIAMRRRAAPEVVLDDVAPAPVDSADQPLPFPSRVARGEDLTPALRHLVQQRPEETEQALRDALGTLQRLTASR